METSEYSLDPRLEGMIEEIKGKADRFIHLEVQFGKKEPRSFGFAGDSEDLVDRLAEIVKKGDVKVITQAIGTYTEGSSPRDNFKK